jgi:hypothetical protein|tara:strand:- start:12529 stop:12690 length:162 start_codon:yes stop_codon:yes gene_type:complete
MPNKGDSKSSKYDIEPRTGKRFEKVSPIKPIPPKSGNLKVTHPEEHGVKADGK